MKPDSLHKKNLNDGRFFQQCGRPRKVMLLDQGFIGDTVHLIPSAWLLRQAWPQAELHLMVAAHAADLLRLFPWLDRVWAYPRRPKKGLWHELKWLLALRREGFDVVINLCGSHRSSLHTLLSGAPLRLGRLHKDRPARWAWYFTHRYWLETGKEPIWRQRTRVLEWAGFPAASEPPPFTLPAEGASWLQEEGLQGETFAHVSPFASERYKELPPKLLIDFLDRLLSERHRLVLSCAPNEAERLKELVAALEAPPWRVYTGLDLVRYAALIRGARAHLGGDSGGLHVARLVSTPTLTWFRDYDNILDWKAEGPSHVSLVGKRTPEGLGGISREDLSAAFNRAWAAAGDQKIQKDRVQL